MSREIVMDDQNAHWSEKPWVQKGIYNGKIQWYNQEILEFVPPAYRSVDEYIRMGLINISLANNGTEEEELPMFTYGILARTMLQEADEADKKGPITGILSFEIVADDFADAADQATELLTDNYSVISVSEIAATPTE